jgi:hypothetical protein
VTLSSGFFNSIGSDRLYSADDFANYLNGIITDGCIPNNTGLKVLQGTQGQLGSNPPSVVISPGKAYIRGMWLYNTENLTFNLGTIPQVNPGLIHLVYLKCDTDGDRETTIECYTGYSPVLPTSTSTVFYMALASVADQQGTQPANAHITDLRPAAGVSGTGITTASLVDECVTTAKIDDLGVTTAKLNNLAVTTAKLDDGAVTPDKISSTFCVNKMMNFSTHVDFPQSTSGGNYILSPYYTFPDLNISFMTSEDATALLNYNIYAGLDTSANASTFFYRLLNNATVIDERWIFLHPESYLFSSGNNYPVDQFSYSLCAPVVANVQNNFTLQVARVLTTGDTSMPIVTLKVNGYTLIVP